MSARSSAPAGGPSTPRLIALDWGTSNLRASLLGEGGRLLERRTAPGGIMAVPDGRFEEALRALCADWLERHPVPLIASGMIGSRQGWREAPYVACPAAARAVADRLTTVSLSDGATLHIVPGLHCIGDDAVDDVMRGEETQLWGADLAPASCAVLPGTHSKWAWTGAAGEILRFQTYMTGELYGLLTRHSILGRLMAFGHERPAEFERGARIGLAEHARLSHIVFAARTSGLMGRTEPEGLPDFLSGLLVGAEIGAALGAGAAPPPQVVLIGEADLCRRYEQALRLAGVPCHRADEEVTTRGQWRLACAAGLVADEGGAVSGLAGVTAAAAAVGVTP
jgi:2-dehydro-3-deoxygalactonokinase